MFQPYRLQYPLNTDQVEKLDDMLQILFDKIDEVSETITTIEHTTSTITETILGTINTTNVPAGLALPLSSDTDYDEWNIAEGVPLAESYNIPRLNARTNFFVSDLTTQQGGIRIQGVGVTSGRVVQIEGSSATPGASASGSVTGSALHVSGNQGSTDTNSVGRNSLVNFTSTINTSTANALNTTLRVGTTVSNTTNASIIYGINSVLGDSTVLANTVYGINADIISSVSAAKIVYGIKSNAGVSSNTANTVHGGYFVGSNSGNPTTGTQNTYGLLVEAQSSSANGATVNVFGLHVRAGGFVNSGIINHYGIRIANPANISTAGTSTSTGLYIDSLSGADTQYGIILAGTNKCGFGTLTPASTISINGGLHVGGDSDAGDNNAIIDGDLTVGDDVAITGDTLLTGGIYVGTTTTANGTLTANSGIVTNSLQTTGLLQATDEPAQTNANAVVVSGFIDGLKVKTWDMLGAPTGTNTEIAFGGYRASQWVGIRFYTSGAEKSRIDTNGQMSLGGAFAPTGQLHVDQASTTAAIPVLILDQADDDQDMIEFIGTIGTGNAIEDVGAKTLTTTHFIKVTLPGGLTRYFPVGTIA